MAVKNDKSGIYKITNLANSKIYIGESKAIYHRWYAHKCALRKNKHSNQYLQNAWNKYKEDFFKFEIIELLPDAEKSELLIRENYWIEFYKSGDVEIGYNIPKINDFEKERNRRKLYEKKKAAKKVYQFDKVTGQLVKIWEGGVSEIAAFYLLSTKAATKKLFFKSKSYKGFVWVMEKNYDANKDYKVVIKPREKKIKLPKIPKPMEERNLRRKPISLQNINTNETLSFKSISEASKSIGFTNSVIYCLIKGYKSKGGGVYTKINQWRGWKIANVEPCVAHI